MLYAVKNDEGKYQTECTGDLWRELGDDTEVYGEKLDAMEDAREFGGHVVKLVEAPAKVVITKEQAEIVEEARVSDIPASYISGHSDVYNGEESLLMNAYVNGYTVAKEKKYNVKVPHMREQYYYVDDEGELRAADRDTNDESNQQFTLAEIEHYGLTDCEKVVCADSARTTGEEKGHD